jgi:DNA-binding response OmpR family regulator/signal transduction histidine kinase
VITLFDNAGQIQDSLASGITSEQMQQLWNIPSGEKFFEYLSQISEPLRVRDFMDHARSQGLPPFRPPMPVSPSISFLAAPILHSGESVGNICVAEKEDSQEFTPEDEETLVMFASQAAMVIDNARRYRDEQRARTDLETLINTSPVGVVVFDARTGVPVSLNREATRIVSGLQSPGVSVEELLKVITIRRGDGREIALDEFPLAQVLSTGETVRAEEFVIQVPDGRSVTTVINATPIYSEDGDVESVVVTLQDMTPLEELERLRAELLAMVSHELRSPLTSIKGSAATLLEASSDLDPAEIFQFHRIINDQADYMRDLIGDLLDVARIETGTLPVVPEAAELADLVDDARNRFLSGGGKNNLQIHLAPDLPQVIVDRRRIGQVLNNLLSNAARHSPEASAIRVTAVPDDFHVAVSVADEGRGVPAERLPHLFQKFFPIDGDDRGREPGGSGLGLAICKGIVEAHGGRIWAESDGPGLGARFTFTIPVAEGAGTNGPTGTARLSTSLRQAERSQGRIVAVDDDPQTLRYVRDALTKAGYTTIVTGTPEEVPSLIETNKPHLVLLDMMLPGTDGIELMKDILAKADVPVIFLSAYGQDQTIARAFEMGASDYVVKPFSPTELVARIRATLRRRAGPDLTGLLEPYVLRDLSVNYAERRVTLAGHPVRLTPTEYQLLAELSVNAGVVLTHDQLLQRVWGPGNSSDSRPVRTVVKNLRRKLGEDAGNPTYIFTEPRIGYRMGKN